MRPSRRRSAVVTVGVVALATSLSGCSGPDYRGICADRTTNTRVADRDCDDDETGGSGGLHGWYYLRGGSRAPAVGAPLAGGAFTVPAGSSTVDGGVSAKGGTVARGGFSGWASSVGG